VTGDQVPVDDPDVLHRILANTEALLLDFDGPVCSVFAGIPAHYIADQLREVLAQGGHTDLPAEIGKTEDPFDVFRYAASLGEDEAHYVEAALRAHEVEAVGTAEPTSNAHELIHAWHATGRKLAIVSNNPDSAVETYLAIHGLTSNIDVIASRTRPDPDLLKPSAHLIQIAVRSLMTFPGSSTLIGDSASDITAANRASVPSVGFCNKPGKHTALTATGALTVTTRFWSLLPT
jgi:beta-phosphoglucomutase-like phosphatase (HAD superfamily)